MAYLTKQQLINKVVRRVRQVPGYNVQVYSEDLISDYIDEKFIEIFETQFWTEFVHSIESPMNTTTGVPINDLSMIATPQDLLYIYGAQRPRPMRFIPHGVNPEMVPTTYDGQYVPYPEAPWFKVYPKDNFSTVTVWYRKRPTLPFGETEIVPFDSIALIVGAAHDLLADEEVSPTAVARLMNQFNTRIAMLTARDTNKPIFAGNVDGGYPRAWVES